MWLSWFRLLLCIQWRWQMNPKGDVWELKCCAGAYFTGAFSIQFLTCGRKIIVQSSSDLSSNYRFSFLQWQAGAHIGIQCWAHKTLQSHSIVSLCMLNTRNCCAAAAHCVLSCAFLFLCSTSMCVCICVYACMCVCVWERERERERAQKKNRE